MDVQMKRGLLDICVLSAIKNEDSYGYKIIKDIRETPMYPAAITTKVLRYAKSNRFGSARSARRF